MLAVLAWSAQASAEPAGCEAAEYRVFDFWVGDWEVRLADGTLAGHNEVRREEGGCLLREIWRGAQSGSGSSINFFEPVDRTWRQIWVSTTANIDISGTAAEGSVVLSGTITYRATAQRFPFRGSWTRLADGRVRQFFEESREKGVWEPWFEGYYTRQEPSD
ncbi:MAG: hypothetical protein GWM88_11730 [Pseudomonadales bacterium]|nr:hypothetical protein [Pseudomonadales bacterium]NIX08627.1 hypothetical protein [Pseudomonadales bacterium]